MVLKDQQAHLNVVDDLQIYRRGGHFVVKVEDNPSTTEIFEKSTELLNWR